MKPALRIRPRERVESRRPEERRPIERRPAVRLQPRQLEFLRKRSLNNLESIALSNNPAQIRAAIIDIRRVLPYFSPRERRVYAFLLTQVIRNPQLKSALFYEIQNGKNFREAYSTAVSNFIDFIRAHKKPNAGAIEYAKKLDYVRRYLNSYNF